VAVRPVTDLWGKNQRCEEFDVFSNLN
jgi:hypothetical protein